MLFTKCLELLVNSLSCLYLCVCFKKDDRKKLNTLRGNPFFFLITGHKIGINYEFKSGGGFVVGLDDLSGPDVAYVYPDMKTMIVGRFKKGQLVSGLEAELNGLTYADNGLLRPLYQIKGQNSMTYSVSNQTWIGSDPLIRDPLEVELVKG